ncbi:MAG TPA: hypothetical protein VGM06_13525 [Polyangiaceae bacterium]
MARFGVAAFALVLGSLGADAPLETLAAFDPTLGQIPESVTTDHEGNLFFSWASTSTIQKRTPDGTITPFGTLPIPVFTLGVKVGPDGCVYTVSLTATPGAFVWRICTAGAVEQFAVLDPNGGPNDLAFDDDGVLNVTDPFLGQIWRVGRSGEGARLAPGPLARRQRREPRAGLPRGRGPTGSRSTTTVRCSSR